MKITDVRTTLLTGPCTDDPFLSERRYPFVPGSGEFNRVPGHILKD